MVQLVKSPEWLRQINGTIGGSTAAAAIGESRYRRTPMDVYRTLCAVADGQELHAREPNDDMRRGTILEPVALEILASDTGLPIYSHDQDSFCRRDEFPWAHALPDGWADSGNERGIVEIKVPRTPTWSKVNMGDIPRDWLIQCQHNIALANADVCHLGVMDPLSCRVTHVPLIRDDDEIRRIMQREQSLWECVQQRTPPEFDEPAVEEECEPETDEPPTNFDNPELVSLAKQYLRLRDIAHEASGCTDEAKARLLQEMSQLGEPDYFEILGVDFTDHNGREYPNARFHWRERSGGRQFLKQEALVAMQKAYELLRQIPLSVDDVTAHEAAIREWMALFEREHKRGDDAWCKRTKPSRPLLVYPGRQESAHG